MTVVELAAAAKHIAQQMVQLIPHLQMTPEHLDQLLAHGEVALWVESAHIDACGLVSTSPLSHSRTSPRAERRAVERSGAEQSSMQRN